MLKNKRYYKKRIKKYIKYHSPNYRSEWENIFLKYNQLKIVRYYSYNKRNIDIDIRIKLKNTYFIYRW